MNLPAPVDMDIDDFNVSNSDNYDDVRGWMMSSNKTTSRMVSMSSSEASEEYTSRMEHLNNLPDDEEIREPIGSSQLFYVEGGGEGNPVSKAADSSTSKEQQCVNNEIPALSRATNSNEHGFNVQIPYDVNQALDPESWDGNFHTISLHGLMEHLASDVKHIKESLHWIQKYILNKLIEGDKANNVKDLEGISEVAWDFISALYESHWDHLIADKNNFSFKWKVKAQFNK